MPAPVPTPETLVRAALPRLELRDIRVTFGTLSVLDGLTLSVAPAQMTGLIGPSGCGKTTLLRVAAGLQVPDAGTVSVEPGLERGALGYLFQEPNLLPWLNTLDNVALPLRLLKMSLEERRQRAQSALEHVGLGAALRRHPHALSGGMRMRAALARALVAQPRLLLLDEPFGALDALTRRHLNTLLLDLRRATPWTGLLVTHSAAEAVRVCDSVVVLSPCPARAVLTLDTRAPGKAEPGWPATHACFELTAAVEAAVLAQEAA